MRGVVGTPKTVESLAPIPLLAQVKSPLGLWWKQCGQPTEGWIFPSANGTPVDLHNLVARVIRPHVEGSAYRLKGKAEKCIRCGVVPMGVGKWKAIYAGRRGAGTAIVEVTNGNLAVAQALLRHKNQMTTATFYKKPSRRRLWWPGSSCWKLLPMAEPTAEGRLNELHRQLPQEAQKS